ncbi:MAG: pyrroline-5-carboxylate reductase [Bacteroidaceae bacterium]|nr:pyrroline-5-carboxylate reductase [Bacteroidaceae bacterium]MBQ9294209.1 pyrroline-5-carboxylate reductase [Bacteroidaceae bacterium]
MKISVIGAGNMGGALIKGWTKAGMAADITATAHTQKTLDDVRKACPGITTTLDNKEAVRGADVVVLAVKPWLVGQVLSEIMPELKEQLVVSVAAGIRHERIDVYAMPNIAAEFGESMTFVEEAPQAETVAELFGRVGQSRVVPRRLMEAGMMMAGCGIAYVMRFLRAMMEGGVEMGFYPDDAKQIAMQTMQGAVSLLRETGLHPEAAIDKVTTPGGITIKGLNELDHACFSSAVIRCLKAGLEKQG